MPLDRVADAERKSRQRAEGREVTIPPCLDPARRASCEMDVVLFAETYFRAHPDFPDWDALLEADFSPRHIEILEDMARAIRWGGLKAVAAPRGFGKDTLATIVFIWAILYGHIKCGVIACYELKASRRTLNRIKKQLEYNPLLAADFPEVSACVAALQHSPQRCKNQTWQGRHTNIVWSQNEIRMPETGGPCAGSWILIASIKSSIRGILTDDGTRPDFVYMSDPSTDQSAHSQGDKSQTETTIRNINQDIGGLGSHSKPLTCFALVTLICKNDVADQLTDRTLNPQWRGTKFGAFIEWPKRMDLWAQYNDLMTSGARAENPTDRTANSFYLANRAEMDSGAVVSWPDGFIKICGEDGTPLENSAIQHCMNLRWTWGEKAFQTEYQNDPPIEETNSSELTIELITSRATGVPQLSMPPEYSYIARGVDIGGRLIHTCTLAAKRDMTAHVIDYSVIDTGLSNAVDLRDDSAQARKAIEHAIHDALSLLRQQDRDGEYVDDAGVVHHVGLTLIDSGWMRKVISAFCGQSGQRYRAIKGLGSSEHKRFVKPTDKKKVVSEYWFAARQDDGRDLYFLDADHWKLYVHQRLLQDVGTVGALTLFGDEPRKHIKFAQHILGENFDVSTGKWKKTGPNHWLDATAYAFAALDMLGVRMPGQGQPRAKVRRGNEIEVIHAGSRKIRSRY